MRYMLAHEHGIPSHDTPATQSLPWVIEGNRPNRRRWRCGLCLGITGELAGHLCRGCKGLCQSTARTGPGTVLEHRWAIMATSKPAAILSATRSNGDSPPAAIRANLSSPGLAAIGMIESETERGGVTEKNGAITCAQASSMLKPSHASCAAIGGSKTASIGYWMSSSMTISRACAPPMGPPTWRSSNTWR